MLTKFICKKIEPNKLSPEEIREIVSLHQDYFHISEDYVITLLNKRDTIRIYRDKKTNILIGTVGVQHILIDNKIIILYLGNIVVKDQYQRYGILTHTIMREICNTIFKYPTLKKYQMSLSSTPKAFNYYQSLPIYWPSIHTSTPNYVDQIFDRVAKVLFDSNYYVENGNYIIDSLKKNKVTVEDKQPKNQEFAQLNPQYKDGCQLLCCVEFNIKNFLFILKKNLNKLFFKR